MKILLTGGSGFLGQALATTLIQAGHDVVLPLRQATSSDGLVPAGATVTLIPDLASMRSADWVPLLKGVDAVIHAAAIAHIGALISSERYQAINHLASRHLAEAAATTGVSTFVFVSSIRAQVGPSSLHAQSESSPIEPTEPYGESKRDAELAIRSVLPQAIIMRPALIVGGEAKGNLATLLRLAHLPVPLPFKSLDHPQAMVCRDNFIAALLLSLSSKAMVGETYVVADEPHFSIASILTELRAGMERAPRLFTLPVSLLTLPLRLAGKQTAIEKITGSLRVDSSKLRRAGWLPVVSPEAALQMLAKV